MREHGPGTGAETLSLAGEWAFALDPEDVGVERAWYDGPLDGSVRLPGSTDENGEGDPATRRAHDHLTREYSYEGTAWYRRTVSLPDSWADRHVRLFLERTRATRVWVDGREVGDGDDADGLSTPHEYDLGRLDPGRHALTFRVDNDAEVFGLPGVQRSHAATEHTQTNWNGVVGAVELRAFPPVHVAGLRTTPDPGAGSVTVEAAVRNRGESDATGTLSLAAVGRCADEAVTDPPPADDAASVTVGAGEAASVTVDYDLGDDPTRWDEWTPAYYDLDVTLAADADGSRRAHTRTTRVGLRTFETEGAQFTVNGRTTFLRGNVDCCVFPRTGYPPTDIESWRDVLSTAREYGVNHYRFHSWCPPEAAFAAADELGVYLQPELPCWNNGSAFEDEFAVDYYRAEADRILDTYGHHPSFVAFALGNELSGDRAEMEALVDRCRARDPDRLYAAGSYNFLSDSTRFEADDYWTTASVPVEPGDAEGGRAMVRGAGIDDEPPATTTDYREAIEDVPVPVVAHEIGQYQVYPDYEELDEYTGPLRPGNLELARDHLEAHRMRDRAGEFAAASGRLAVECYREEVEAALRTPGFGGFQLLELQDFPGQGTALVGVLDAFMNSKGLVDPAEWRAFCSETVPLARLDARTFAADDRLRAEVQVAHYGPTTLDGVTPEWRLVAGDDDRTVAGGTLDRTDVPQGTLADLGVVEADLGEVPDAPARVELELSVGGATNAYDVWVYPPADPLPDLPSDEGETVADADGVAVRRAFDEGTRERLDEGGTVLLIPDHDDLSHAVEGAFAPCFWSYALFKRNAPPGTMGAAFDPDDSLFESFPTGGHADWQWWPVLDASRPVVLDDAPGEYVPTVSAVDNIERNQKLGLVFGTAYGEGRLLVCASDLFAAADRPSTRAFYAGLLSSAGSEAFDPDHAFNRKLLDKLLSG